MLLTAGIENGEFNHDVHFQFLQHTKEVSLKLDESGKPPKSWILLDNQSTVDVFYNANLLRNIRKVEKHMDIHCNAGVTSTNLVGDLLARILDSAVQSKWDCQHLVLGKNAGTWVLLH